MFDVLHRWDYLGMGRLGLVLSAELRSSQGNAAPRRYAVKFQAVQLEYNTRREIAPTVMSNLDDLNRTTQRVPESVLCVEQGVASLPIVRLDTPPLETRNMLIISHVLNPSKRADALHNFAEILDWTRVTLPRGEETVRRFRGESRLDLSRQLEEMFKARESKNKEQFDFELKSRLARQLEPPAPPNPLTSIRFAVTVSELVRGVTLDTLLGTPETAKGIFERTENFMCIWMQIACTLQFLSRRVEFRHGDMHLNNVMVEDLDEQTASAGPNGGLRNRSLRYELPIVDQLKNESAWRFFTPPVRYLVKIIDTGLARTRLSLAEDLRDIDDNRATFAYDVPHFYLYRGDLSTVALVVLMYWGSYMEYQETQLRGDQNRLRAIVNAALPMLRVLLHALGRSELAPYAHNPARDVLTAFINEAYRTDSNVPVSGTFTGARRTAWGKPVHEKAREIYQQQLECIRTRREDRPAQGNLVCGTRQPMPLTHGRTSAGPWSIDEHLVMFARDFGGFMAGTRERHATMPRHSYLTDHRMQNSVAMLPRFSEWPASFHPSVRASLEALHRQAPLRPVRYPRFVGDEYVRVYEFSSDIQLLSVLDEHVHTYRAEQRAHDELYQAPQHY